MSEITFPSDEDAERAIIGACMLDPTQLTKVRDIIAERDFWTNEAKLIFGVLCLMADVEENFCDPVLVMARLKSMNKIKESGGAAYLAACTRTTPESAVYYASIVVDHARRRSLMELGRQLNGRAGRIGSTETPDQIQSWLESRINTLGIDSSDGKVVSIYEASIESKRRTLSNAANTYAVGIPSGLDSLDRAMGGLYPGELCVVAARPSMGKTSLGIQQAKYAASKGRKVLFVSLEMKDWELAQRVIAGLAGVNSQDLRAGNITGSDIDAMDQAIDSVEKLSLHIWKPTKPTTIEQIRAKARMMQATIGLDMLVVDYLTKIKATDTRAPRNEQIEHQIGTSKDVASELDVPTIMLAQAKRTDKPRPVRLEDLYGSSTIEADADSVLLIHRETRNATTASIEIAKNRFGATGALQFTYQLETCEFFDESTY